MSFQTGTIPGLQERADKKADEGFESDRLVDGVGQEGDRYAQVGWEKSWKRPKSSQGPSIWFC